MVENDSTHGKKQRNETVTTFDPMTFNVSGAYINEPTGNPNGVFLHLKFAQLSFSVT